jgi:hypothetical protein
MTDFSVRLLQCFERAKQVNHYYWMHTEADDGSYVRVENIEHIISRMTKTPIIKQVVPFEGTIVRGMCERYDDRVQIYIRAAQPTVWVRYTIIKELCHVLNDQPCEYSPRGQDTIEAMVRFVGLAPGNGMSDVLQSERLAEITALELLYPLEFRDGDRAIVENGGTIDDIVSLRQVPSAWVQRGLDQNYCKACRTFWRALPDNVPPPLEAL